MIIQRAVAPIKSEESSKATIDPFILFAVFNIYFLWPTLIFTFEGFRTKQLYLLTSHCVPLKSRARRPLEWHLHFRSLMLLRRVGISC